MNRPVHFEIMGENPEALAAFYRDLLDWEIVAWNGPQAYWLVTTGPEGSPGINGAIMHRHFPQAVINTVEVESLDEMLRKVAAAGGKIVNGPNQIPGIGTHAYCADPQGNLFGLLQPAPQTPRSQP
jgi:predicted enzyme related to lactoylglutathione lyase